MEVEFQATREDYLAAYRHIYFRRNLGRKIGAVIWVSLLGTLQERNTPIDWHAALLRSSILLVLSVLSVFLVPYFVALQKIKRASRESSSIFDKRKIILKDDGFEVASGHDKLFWRFESVRIGWMSKDYIFIVLLNSENIVLPVRSFNKENDAVNFYAVIRKDIAVARSQKGNEYMSRLRLYGVGFLGILPWVGGLAGLFLIYRGFVKYKDRVMVLIGFGVLVFQAFVFFMLFYYLPDSPEGKKAKAKIVQDHLTEAVRRIEFYKTQNGNYPDSLEQISKEANPVVIIFDPHSPKNTRHNYPNFQYRRVANKYTLYSVGPDGMPDTKDDIFPDLEVKDTANCGLIKMH